MTAQLRWTCPSCKHPSGRSHPQTEVRVCPRCKALVQVGTKEEIHSKVGYFPSQHIFHVGKKYQLKVMGIRDSWMALGILNMAGRDESLWDEIYLVNRSGDELWVSCSEGEIYAHREIERPSLEGLLDSPEEVKGRAELEYQSVPFSRDDEGSAYVRGMIGEFNYRVQLKDRVYYWEGYDPEDEDCLSAEWGSEESSVTWSHGTWVDPALLKRQNRVSPKASAGGLKWPRIALVLSIWACFFFSISSEGSSVDFGELKPQLDPNSPRAFAKASSSIWLNEGESVDILLVPSQKLYPLRLGAELVWRGNSSPSAVKPIFSKEKREKRYTAVDQLVIKLTELETTSSSNRSFIKAPRLLTGETTIETHVTIPRDGYYTLEVWGSVDRDLPTTTSASGMSVQKSVGLSLSTQSTTQSTTSSDTNLTMSQSIEYFIIAGAYETQWLLYMIGAFLILLITPITRWVFGFLNKLFGLR